MSDRAPFRRDIQGLRAIAVSSVVVSHAWSSSAWLKGGFVGVDVFFVISGYLITKILAKEKASGSYSLAGFYRRRMRRLIPALVVVLITSLLVGLFVLPAPDMRGLGLTAAATVLFSSNFVFFRMSDYFGPAAEHQPLLHTWSLAVEEQFYIVFPLFLMLVWKYAGRLIVPLITVIIVSSFASGVMIGESLPSKAFYMPWSRAHELLIGALIALTPDLANRASQRLKDALSIIGLVIIFASLLLIDQRKVLFPGYVVLAPCLGTALVIAAGQGAQTVGGRLISSSPFQFLGNISYSLYLWHWPILVFARHGFSGPLSPVMSLEAVLLAVALGYLSYRFVERPFISGLEALPVIRLGSAVGAVVAAIGGLIFVSDGWEQRFSPLSKQIAAAKDDFNPKRRRCHIYGRRLRAYESTCVFGDGDVSVAVWADSHGAELALALSGVLEERNVAIRSITASGCPPALGYSSIERPLCAEQNATTLKGLENDRSIGTVLIAVNFEGHDLHRTEIIAAGIERSVRSLIAAGKRVVLLSQIPNQLYDPPAALSVRADRAGALTAWGRSIESVERDLGHYRNVMRRISDRTGARLFDPIPILCGEICPAYDPELGVLYFNQTHLSMIGARKLARSMESLFVEGVVGEQTIESER